MPLKSYRWDQVPAEYQLVSLSWSKRFAQPIHLYQQNKTHFNWYVPVHWGIIVTRLDNWKKWKTKALRVLLEMRKSCGKLPTMLESLENWLLSWRLTLWPLILWSSDFTGAYANAYQEKDEKRKGKGTKARGGHGSGNRGYKQGKEIWCHQSREGTQLHRQSCMYFPVLLKSFGCECTVNRNQCWTQSAIYTQV